MTMSVVVLWVSVSSAQSAAVAKVNDTVLTDAELEEAIDAIIPTSSFHVSIDPEKRQKYRAEALERLINDELLYQEAVRDGLKIERGEVDSARDFAIARVGGKKNYKEALKNAGLSDRQYRDMIKRSMLIQKIRNIEIEEKAQISDEDARAYYEENKKGFKRPDTWRIRHILISVAPSASEAEWQDGKKRAEEALKKIKDGEDMASVAWDYSDDPYRVKGGDLGMVHSGRMIPELEGAARELKVGEVSDIIQSIYGYHIVRVEEKMETEQLNYEDVEKTIKTKLSMQKRKELEEKLFERLKAEARIEVY